MAQDTDDTKRWDWIPITSLGLAVLVGVLLYFKGGDPVYNLKVLSGYVALILVFFFGFMVLIDIVRGKIDLRYLISEEDGSASMSRFQLLIFTFVIALSFVLLVVSSNPPSFPALPREVLILLGISATTYGVSKGIQKSAEMAQNQPPTQTGAPEADEDKTKSAGAS